MWKTRELENYKLFLISWQLHLACPMFCIRNWISNWNMIFVTSFEAVCVTITGHFPKLCVQFFRTDWALCFQFQFSDGGTIFSLTLHLFFSQILPTLSYIGDWKFVWITTSGKFLLLDLCWGKNNIKTWSCNSMAVTLTPRCWIWYPPLGLTFLFLSLF